MIIRDITYKGVSLSDANAYANRIKINSVTKDVKLRTAVYDRANWHGANSSYTLASWRLFTFEGQIFGVDRSSRFTGQNLLNSIIVPESNPNETNKGFYSLTWIDDGWNEMECMAKVFTMPKYEHVVWSDIIAFTFELYSEEAYYTWVGENVENWVYWVIGGVSLPVYLPTPLYGIDWAFTVENTGNFASQCKIEIIGNIVNPKISNITAGSFYGIEATTSDLIIDTRSVPAIITDAGSDVSAYRMPWSQYITVLPGINTFILTGDNFTYDNTVTVQVTYKDTYISS